MKLTIECHVRVGGKWKKAACRVMVMEMIELGLCLDVEDDRLLLHHD